MKNRRISIKKFIKHPHRAILEILQFGDEVLLTIKGKSILKIVPLTKDEMSRLEILDKLARMLGVRVGSHKEVPLPKGVPLQGEGPTASEMILEDRR